MFDLLIENGFIVDGSGQPGFTGDLGITKDRVVAMGDLGPVEDSVSLGRFEFRGVAGG